jgi:hypothetical protein
MYRVSEKAVKIATPDLVLIKNDPVPGNTMAALLFQKISNVEVINLSRSSLVNGANYRLQPIQDLKEIELQYNSATIIPMPDSSSLYFDNYPIKFESYIPTQTSDPNNENVYIDSNGNLIIELANLPANILVEVDVINNLQNFDFLDDTIYGEGNL